MNYRADDVGQAGEGFQRDCEQAEEQARDQMPPDQVPSCVPGSERHHRSCELRMGGQRCTCWDE
jgi:hypothetical protein